MPFLANTRGRVSRAAHHSAFSSPAIALCLAALSLLLLVLVLLSVPGPIKGLYWFSVNGDVSGMGKLTSGVLGWCGEFPLGTNRSSFGLMDSAEVDTSNCTYAPLSDNAYLASKIDVGLALTTRMMLPLGGPYLGLFA